MPALKTLDRRLFSQILSLFEIQNETQAIELEEYLETVLEEVASGREELRPLLNFIEKKLDDYKISSLKESASSGADVLRFLMAQHGHTQQDLSHLIARSTVSELRNGKRMFTLDHCRKLGEFYHVTPEVFI